MPVRPKNKRRRQMPEVAVRWLLGQRTFFGLIPHTGWPFGNDELRDFWREHREWALSEASRRGLPQPWQEVKYARSKA